MSSYEFKPVSGAWNVHLHQEYTSKCRGYKQSGRQIRLWPIRFCLKLLGVEDVSTDASHFTLLSSLYRCFVLLSFHIYLLRALSQIVYYSLISCTIIDLISRGCELLAKSSLVISFHLLLWRRKNVLDFFKSTSEIIEEHFPTKLQKLSRRLVIFIALSFCSSGAYFLGTVQVFSDERILQYFPVVFYGLNATDPSGSLNSFSGRALVVFFASAESAAIFYYGMGAVLSASASSTLEVLIQGLNIKLYTASSAISAKDQYRPVLQFHSQLISLIVKADNIFSSVHSMWMFYFLFFMFKAIPYVLERSEIGTFFRIMNSVQIMFNVFTVFLYSCKAADVFNKSQSTKLHLTIFLLKQYLNRSLSREESHFLTERLSYPLYLSLGGFFQFTRSLIVSLVSALLSYLCLIYQLIDDDEKLKEKDREIMRLKLEKIANTT